MKKTSVLFAVLTSATALPFTAHALPAVQRTVEAQLPAVQSGWFMALIAQLQAIFGA